mmetsp:Transcript_45059/g.136611  ORF Transcript_45059/g.136611 Transcript_45059/m.136611 type:complete len:219 (-) Transcript_45059:177-833(-)
MCQTCMTSTDPRAIVERLQPSQADPKMGACIAITYSVHTKRDRSWTNRRATCPPGGKLKRLLLAPLERLREQARRARASPHSATPALKYAATSSAGTTCAYKFLMTSSAASAAAVHEKTASSGKITLKSSVTARMQVAMTQASVQQPVSTKVSTPQSSSMALNRDSPRSSLLPKQSMWTDLITRLFSSGVRGPSSGRISAASGVARYVAFIPLNSRVP